MWMEDSVLSNIVLGVDLLCASAILITMVVLARCYWKEVLSREDSSAAQIDDMPFEADHVAVQCDRDEVELLFVARSGPYRMRAVTLSTAEAEDMTMRVGGMIHRMDREETGSLRED